MVSVYDLSYMLCVVMHLTRDLFAIAKFFLGMYKKRENIAELLTTPHHSASAYDPNIRGFLSFSTRYMRKDENMRPRKPIYTVVNNS